MSKQTDNTIKNYIPDAGAEASKQPAKDELQQGTPDSVSDKPPAGKTPRLDPTRYGDWEKNGRCIDF